MVEVVEVVVAVEEKGLIRPNTPRNTKVRPDAGQIVVLLIFCGLIPFLCLTCFAVAIRVTDGAERVPDAVA